MLYTNTESWTHLFQESITKASFISFTWSMKLPGPLVMFPASSYSDAAYASKRPIPMLLSSPKLDYRAEEMHLRRGLMYM